MVKFFKLPQPGPSRIHLSFTHLPNTCFVTSKSPCPLLSFIFLYWFTLPKRAPKQMFFRNIRVPYATCHNLFSPCLMTSVTLLQSTQTFLAASEKMWFSEKMWQYSHQLPWQRLHQVKMFCPVPRVWMMDDDAVWPQTQRSLTLPAFL